MTKQPGVRWSVAFATVLFVLVPVSADPALCVTRRGAVFLRNDCRRRERRIPEALGTPGAPGAEGDAGVMGSAGPAGTPGADGQGGQNGTNGPAGVAMAWGLRSARSCHARVGNSPQDVRFMYLPSGVYLLRFDTSAVNLTSQGDVFRCRLWWRGGDNTVRPLATAAAAAGPSDIVHQLSVVHSLRIEQGIAQVGAECWHDHELPGGTACSESSNYYTSAYQEQSVLTIMTLSGVDWP